MKKGHRLKKTDLPHIQTDDQFIWTSITTLNELIHARVVATVINGHIEFTIVEMFSPVTATTPHQGEIINPKPIIGELRFIEEDGEIFPDPKDGVIVDEGMYKNMFYTVYQTPSGRKFLRFTIHIWNGFSKSRADMRLLDNIGEKNAAEIIDALIDSIPSLNSQQQ